jgi:dethiobiotin synthetase
MARYVFIVGTDTGVGKTVTMAAVATHLATMGNWLALVKPIQTGLVIGEYGDVQVASHLSGVTDVHEFVRLPDPLAPDAAARLRQVAVPTIEELAGKLRDVPVPADTVLVEGSGGVRVRLDTRGGTILDLARGVRDHGDVEVIVVVRAGLGTLNHTELTVEAIRRADLPLTGLIIGSWPDQPDLAAGWNILDLPRVSGLPLLARLPEGAGRWSPNEFQHAAWRWFSRRL